MSIYVSGKLQIIGDDDTTPWREETVDGVSFSTLSAGFLLVTSASALGGLEFKRFVHSALPALSCLCVFDRLRALQFRLVSMTTTLGLDHDAGQFEPLSSHALPRYGFQPLIGVRDQVDRITQEVVARRLASVSASFPPRPEVVYGVECLARSVIYPDFALGYLYKALEQFQHAHGRGVFEEPLSAPKWLDTTIGRLANSQQHDQRHAPRDPQSTDPVSPDTIEACRREMRALILRAAALDARAA
jgi:hypothetical protein